MRVRISTYIFRHDKEKEAPNYRTIPELDHLVQVVRSMIKMSHLSDSFVRCYEISEKVDPSEETNSYPYKHTWTLDIDAHFHDVHSYHYFLGAVQHACDLARYMTYDYVTFDGLHIIASTADDTSPLRPWAPIPRALHRDPECVQKLPQTLIDP